MPKRTWKIRRCNTPQQRGLREFALSIPEERRDLLVEVGSFIGESAYILSQYFRRVVCVDPWLPGPMKKFGEGLGITCWSQAEGIFDRNNRDIPSIIKIRGVDLDVAPLFAPASIDVLYLDHEHTYEACIASFQAWLDKIKPEGYYCGHDYNFIPVREACLHWMGEPEQTFRDYSWLYSKATIVRRRATLQHRRDER